MARPFIATDEEVLDAAQRVLARRGPDRFSVAEVAAEVGLSRAAIILRFKSTRALRMQVMERMADRFNAGLAALPKTPGGDSLLHVAAFVGAQAQTREGAARFIANFTSNLQDRELLSVVHKRGEALAAAISSAMPPVAIGHASAVMAFRAHLSGSIINWLSLDDGDARRYIVMRAVEWLKLANIPFSEAVVQTLLAAPPAVLDEAKKTKPKKSSRTKRRRRTDKSSAAKAGLRP